MRYTLQAGFVITVAALCCPVIAAPSSGFSTTEGGYVAGARAFNAATHDEINTIIANAKKDDNGKKVSGGAYPLVITYTGNEDALIAEVVRDHTVDASGNCPKPRWSDAYRYVEIKEFTKGITIIGANGSSANFGVVVNKSADVIIRNMKIGALAGANNDADMIRIDSGSNVWVDHNELFAVNNECKGSPDGDLTFESAIDIKKDSHNITVSYNYIHDSKKVGLDGSSSSDIAGGREITFHHNIYRNVSARLPLQRGGWTHIYNNLYDGITDSGINVRQAGYSLIENNWFQNAKNPVTCRYDSSNCGFWELRNNNILTPGDFSTYNITWSGSATVDGINWTTTAPFPIDLPYAYSPVSAQCVKDKLLNYAGVGKNSAQLTLGDCEGAGGVSSAASSVNSSSSSVANSSVASSSLESSAQFSSSSNVSSIVSSVAESSVAVSSQAGSSSSAFISSERSSASSSAVSSSPVSSSSVALSSAFASSAPVSSSASVASEAASSQSSSVVFSSSSIATVSSSVASSSAVSSSAVSSSAVSSSSISSSAISSSAISSRAASSEAISSAASSFAVIPVSSSASSLAHSSLASSAPVSSALSSSLPASSAAPSSEPASSLGASSSAAAVVSSSSSSSSAQAASSSSAAATGGGGSGGVGILLLMALMGAAGVRFRPR